MSTTLDDPLVDLALHPTIEGLLLEAGCRSVRDVLSLPHEKLLQCGISLKELKEIVENVEPPAER